MYAVVKTGGKQYKVVENDLLRIEKIDAEAGTIITLNEVLLVANDNNDVTVGKPLIDGASVAIEILAQRRARKIVIFKKRRRKSSRTKNGHRQHFTLVRISEILTNGATPSKEPQGMPEKYSLRGIINGDDDFEDTSVEQEVIIDAVEAKSAKKTATKKPKAPKAEAEVTDNTESSND
jgi:ribosomal protein L21